METRKLGRAWQLGLVDDSGTVSGMHQVDVETFIARVPGSSPSVSARANFAIPNLADKNMSEHAIGIELTRSTRSVLEAASADSLRILHTPPHKARVGDLGERSDAFNRVGIYLDHEAARRTTTLTDADGKKRPGLTREQIKNGDIGNHSWYWMAVLGVVKSLRNRECAFYMRRAAASEASSDTLFEGDSDASEDNIEAHEPTSDEEDSWGPRGCPPNDPNRDLKPCVKQTDKGHRGLDELADFMFKLLTHQHRVFGYGFYIQWCSARLLYFDRTGVLVSEPFNWTETSSPLHDFVWKIAHMTPTELGYDPTAQQASVEDMTKVFRMSVDPSLPQAIRGYIHDSFFSTTKERDRDEVPIYKLSVPASDSSREEEDSLDSERSLLSMVLQEASQRMFLVGCPYFAADQLVGRCSRGYIAFDLATNEFCFLKDCWRSVIPGRTRPEHLVYDHLHRYNVKHIPTLVCGGDVGSPPQHPATLHSCLAEGMPARRVHYRMVTQQIGLPLSEFTHFGELNHIFLCALQAHYTAWERAGILHRDVSVGNILIDPVTRQGLLIDWGSSLLKSELEQGPVQLAGRSGTWRFLSALALKYPRKPYRLSDDLESFVHAYRWMVLRFHPTNLMDLRLFVQTQYEDYARVGAGTGVRVGGDYKIISHSAPNSVFRVRANDRLQHLLEDLAAGCHQHYQSIDMEHMDELYGVPEPEDLAPPISQPEHIPQKTNPERTFSDETLELINRMRARVSHRDPPPPPSIPPLPDRDAPSSPADPCDIQGFLSAHSHLVRVFKKWKNNDVPRHKDQFLLRCQDEPIYSSDSDSSSTLSET